MTTPEDLRESALTSVKAAMSEIASVAVLTRGLTPTDWDAYTEACPNAADRRCLGAAYVRLQEAVEELERITP